MRTTFHEELRALGDELALMCDLVADAMEQATRALLDVDLGLAEQVVERDSEIDEFRACSEEKAYSLLALQSPVAGDLRFIVMRIHAAEKLERMGDLARHVAEQVRRAHPDSAVPADTRERFAEMGRLAVVAGHNVRQMIAEPGQTRYAELEEADDPIDTLEQSLLASVSSRDWEHGVRAGINVALLARFYERFGDQAVSIVRRLDYVVTGSLPSHPR
jgi:phosphate transport system protein